MRILFVLEHFYPHVGGVELVFQRLAEGLVKQGDTVTVLTTRLPETSARETVNGITIRRAWVPPFLRRYFFTLFALPHALSLARKADVIHTTTYNGAPPAWYASKMTGKPCIITVHEVLGKKWRAFDMTRLNSFFHRVFERYILRLSFSRYICVSNATRDQLKTLGIPHEKISVIYNGVDSDLFKTNIPKSEQVQEMCGIDSEDFVFFYYGRPGMTKGVDTLVRAFHPVVARYPNARLLLMMTRSPRGRYRKLIRIIEQSPAREQIIRLDPVDRYRIADVMSVSDAVVVPSMTEGFGFTAAEAAAAGKPLVVSRAGSLPEVASGNVRWFTPGKVTELSDALMHAVEGDYESIPQKHFLWEDMIFSVHQLYSSISEGAMTK